MLEIGQRFTIRDSKQTIGTGVITKLLPDIPDASIEESFN